MATGATLEIKLDWPASTRRARPRRSAAAEVAHESMIEDSNAETSDEAVVRKILGGDPDSYSVLIERYRGKILGSASRFARNRQELEDISQDIFLKAWKGLKSFRGEAPFEHWMMRLAVRVCYDFLRRNRRYRENEISKELVDETGDRLTDEPEGNRELAASEAREVLHHAMSKLRAKDQLVLNLKEIQRKSIREIAELTGWTESNVKVRAMRARNRLKERLTELGYAE
ncbi:MAG: RNA polymerase sigma-70 factor (ECF subfamily) [Verrucomicrobiales bacterium]|jgi:RNA polymerase sigma-70 factor (ECF subfamily)